MSDSQTDRTILGPVGATGFRDHELRALALSEIHARPFQAFSTPRVVYHYAFVTDSKAAADSHQRLVERCRAAGVPGPGASNNHHVATFGNVRLRWETHSEFTTYTFDMAPDVEVPVPPFEMFLGEGFEQPGPLIVGTRLDLVKGGEEIGELLAGLDPGTTAVSKLRDGRAVGATDFQQNQDGMTRILVIDRGLFPHEVGPVVTRLIELETYRTMALLGLPEARTLQPQITAAEAMLRDATSKIGLGSDLTRNRALLETLTQLAADLEATLSRSAFRFSASRAYSEIAENRLGAIREEPLKGYTRWSSFLQRRMGPAMRTCQSVEARLRELADRLARAANLLRTRIEVDLEQQNRELLAAMNRRGRLQLRLQQWVEGLSVAAVSYYVVSLIYYLATGIDSAGLAIDPYLITGFAIPPVVLGIWFFVRRVRSRSHAEEAAEE